MTTTIKPSLLDRERTALAGVDKRLSGISSLILAGVAYTPAQIKQVLQTHLDAAGQVIPANAAYHAAVKAEHDARIQAVLMLRALKAWAVNQYGANAAPILADLGNSSTTTKKPSAAVKAQAVNLRAATRTLRHTAGKQQKKAIKAVAAVATESPAPVNTKA